MKSGFYPYNPWLKHEAHQSTSFFTNSINSGGLGGPWEAWRKANDDANVWTKVEVPHCFNAFDAGGWFALVGEVQSG